VFRLVTLNLNGIRSAASKGFVEWAHEADADFIGVQEVRAQAEDMAGRFDRIGPLQGHFHLAQKKGYAGVGLYARHEPSVKRCGTGEGYLNETQTGSSRPPGLRIRRAEA